MPIGLTGRTSAPQKLIEARRAETHSGSVHERKGPAMTETEWRSIIGFPGYHVSDDGRVFSKRLSNIMALRRDRYGYLSVSLRHRGVRSTRRVHRLVCEAFHGPAPDEGCHAAHLDGDKLNNAAANVAWATAKENAAHKSEHGTNHGNGGMPGERHPSAKLTAEQVGAIRASPLSSYKAAAAYGVSQGQIMRIRHNVNWRSDLPNLDSPGEQ
jgi:hypothetical protein